jgi:hypothetical protein
VSKVVVAASAHPLFGVLERAADGVFPAVDGLVDVLPPDDAGTWAIAEFTGHAFVLTERSIGDSVFSGVDAFGGVTQPAFVLALAGGGVIGSHDLVLVRRGGSTAAALPETTDFDDHPRVRRARHHRHGVRVLGDERGLVTIGVGLAGRTELSVEVVAADHSAGVGRQLILGGVADVPTDALVFAQVAPGNAASVRAFLSCGFLPIGSEILIEPAGRPGHPSR